MGLRGPWAMIRGMWDVGLQFRLGVWGITLRDLTPLHGSLKLCHKKIRTPSPSYRACPLFFILPSHFKSLWKDMLLENVELTRSRNNKNTLNSNGQNGRQTGLGENK